MTIADYLPATRDQALSTCHMCPPGDAGIMPCCDRTPFEVGNERMTLDPELVTCGRELTVGIQAFSPDLFEVEEGQYRYVHFDDCPTPPDEKCPSDYHHHGRGDHVVPFDADWSPS